MKECVSLVSRPDRFSGQKNGSLADLSNFEIIQIRNPKACLRIPFSSFLLLVCSDSDIGSDSSLVLEHLPRGSTDQKSYLLTQ